MTSSSWSDEVKAEESPIMLLHPLHWNTNGRRSSFGDKFNVRFDCSGSVCEFTAIF